MYSAIAIALIVLPIDPPAAAAHSDRLREALVEAGVAAEILDVREANAAFAPEGFAYELAKLRERWQQLWDVPPAADALRFPARARVVELLELNQKYRRHLDTLSWTDEVREVAAETDRLQCLWDLVRDARCDYNYVTCRRLALKRLRDQLGEQAYYGGCLPPVVPLHRFQLIP
jgi:hypothetical protein